MVLGAVIGCTMRGLRWSQEHLQIRREAATRAAAAEGREEVLEDVAEAAGSLRDNKSD